MKATLFFVMLLAVGTIRVSALPHVYLVPSPTHEQTFSFGSERHQQWLTHGPNRHLALAAEFTNDPYVDKIETREYDDFVFDFPDIRLGSDGRTFYYHAPHGQRIAVAERHKDFLGLEEVHLLPSSLLIMKSPHGYLSLSLLVTDGKPVETAAL